MKKMLVVLAICFCVVLQSNAQTLWKKVLPFPLTWGVYAMFEDTTDHSAYLAGGFTNVNGIPCNMMKWDGGSNFTMLPPSPLYNTSCITKYKGKIYAGGYGLARLDGSSWTYLDSNSLIVCFHHYQDKLLVGGIFDNIGGSGHNSLASWNDTSWSQFLNCDTLFPQGSGSNVATVAEYKGKVYIGGNFNGLSYDTTINDLAVFDGQKWTNVGGQLPWTSLAFVSKLEVWNDTMYVAGDFSELWGCPGNGIASWDGQNWHHLGKAAMGLPEVAITDFIVKDNALYCVGSFKSIDGINLDFYGSGVKNIVKWDGYKWCTLKTVTDLGISYLSLFRDTLYGFGNFSVINTDTIPWIAKWIGGNYVDSCSLGRAGISETVQDASSFELYPNPAQQVLQVKTTSQNTNMILAITDITGRAIAQQQVTNGTKIDVSNFAPGIYLYRLIIDGRLIKTEKFIKE